MSGYHSCVAGEDIFGLEDRCMGKGQVACHLQGRTRAEWGAERAEEMVFYEPLRLVESLDVSLHRVTETLKAAEHKLRLHSRVLKKVVREHAEPAGMVTRSRPMQVLVELARRVVKVDATVLVTGLLAVLLTWTSAPVRAAEFAWAAQFNLSASSDPGAFRTRLGSRFGVDELQIQFVLNRMAQPADAYLVFYLGEVCHHPPLYIIEQYEARGRRGWGELAHQLGIKPGSPEFHELKRGKHVYDHQGKSKSASAGGQGQSGKKGKGNSKGGGKGHK